LAQTENISGAFIIGLRPIAGHRSLRYDRWGWRRVPTMLQTAVGWQKLN
jgi:hypothetical protein